MCECIRCAVPLTSGALSGTALARPPVVSRRWCLGVERYLLHPRLPPLPSTHHPAPPPPPCELLDTKALSKVHSCFLLAQSLHSSVLLAHDCTVAFSLRKACTLPFSSLTTALVLSPCPKTALFRSPRSKLHPLVLTPGSLPSPCPPPPSATHYSVRLGRCARAAQRPWRSCDRWECWE